MTIGYFTDNSVSQGVMRALKKGGLTISHIRNFQFNKSTPAVFYGILRGTGTAMRHLQFLGRDFHYLDNGYFDAVYMDENKRKEMTGTYRVVRGDMIEPIHIDPAKTSTGLMHLLLMPPTTYSAFMYDTTPEDWLIMITDRCRQNGHTFAVRDKEEKIPLKDALKDFDGIIAFNSIGAIKAMELGKAVYTTHGVVRNIDMIDKFAPYYDVKTVKEFYKNKQFTLEQIADRGIKCLI